MTQSYRVVLPSLCKLHDLLCDHLGGGIGAVDQVQSAQRAFKGLRHDGDLVWPKRCVPQKTTEWHDTVPNVPLLKLMVNRSAPEASGDGPV